jgi:hypothetical protein
MTRKTADPDTCQHEGSLVWQPLAFEYEPSGIAVAWQQGCCTQCRQCFELRHEPSTPVKVPRE